MSQELKKQFFDKYKRDHPDATITSPQFLTVWNNISGPMMSPKRKSPKRKRKSRSPKRKSKSPKRKSKSPKRKSRRSRKSKSPKRKSRRSRKSKSPRRKSSSPGKASRRIMNIIQNIKDVKQDLATPAQVKPILPQATSLVDMKARMEAKKKAEEGVAVVKAEVAEVKDEVADAVKAATAAVEDAKNAAASGDATQVAEAAQEVRDASKEVVAATNETIEALKGAAEVLKNQADVIEDAGGDASNLREEIAKVEEATEEGDDFADALEEQPEDPSMLQQGMEGASRLLGVLKDSVAFISTAAVTGLVAAVAMQQQGEFGFSIRRKRGKRSSRKSKSRKVRRSRKSKSRKSKSPKRSRRSRK